MSKTNLKSQIESLLLASGKPISLKEMARIIGQSMADIQNEINSLTQEYRERGLRIIKQGERYFMTTAGENAETVAKFLNEELRYELSPAALEVLAIVVYKQPITRSEIEEIRGADSSKPLRTLMIRGLICETGRKDAPGRPILYGTTVKMMTYLGIEDEGQLQRLGEALPST